MDVKPINVRQAKDSKACDYLRTYNDVPELVASLDLLFFTAMRTEWLDDCAVREKIILHYQSLKELLTDLA